jgi:hemerythrin-like domain-containing protein
MSERGVVSKLKAEATMDSKSPTDILEAEHHLIQKVVGAMAVQAEGLGAGQEPLVETLRSIVKFMRTFADKCHHGKEEVHLFPFLEKRGVPARGCPMGVLLHEHEQGRTLVTQLAQATEAYTSGTASARDAVAAALRGLMELYPNHIWKEEYLLFPMTNKVLGAADQQQLLEQFEAADAAGGRDLHQRFERIAEEIAQGIHAA